MFGGLEVRLSSVNIDLKHFFFGQKEKHVYIILTIRHKVKIYVNLSFLIK